MSWSLRRSDVSRDAQVFRLFNPSDQQITHSLDATFYVPRFRWLIFRFPEITIRRFENAFNGIIITQLFETDLPEKQFPESKPSNPLYATNEQLANLPAGLFSDYYAYQRQAGMARYTPVDSNLPRYPNSMDTAMKGEYDDAIRRLVEKVHSGNWTEETLEIIVPFKEEVRIPKGELVFRSSPSPSQSHSRHGRRRSRSASSSYY